MKTSAVIILVIGAVSLVGGVVALTLPYTGYPCLRHSGFLQVLGVCGIVVGAFISIYYMSNRDQGTRNQYGAKRKHGKTFEKYPDYLGKENLAGPQRPPVQIFTISEKEDTPAPCPSLPVYSRIEKQQLGSHPRLLPSKVSSNIRHPKIQPVSSKPALSCISSTISMTTSNSAGSQHYHPQSSKKKGKNVRKAGKAGKIGKAKSPGSIFYKRKSVAVSSHNGQERSIKPSESAGTPSISGVFSSLKKQAKKNRILKSKLNSHETTGLENLAGPQHKPEEEANIISSEQNPDLSTTNNNRECRIQASVKKIPPSEKTESSIQGKVSPKPNNKAPDTGQKLVRQKYKAQINLQVPEITYKQNKKSKPLDLTADTKRGGQYLFNWKKKRRNLKPKTKATKKIKKVTLFGPGKPISPHKIYQEEVSTGPIQPCNQHRENLESQHLSNLKSNQWMTSPHNPNPTGNCNYFQHLDLSTQILSHPQQPQVYTPSQRYQEEVSTGPIQLYTHHRDDLETQYFSYLKSNQLPTSAHNQNQTAQYFQHQDISRQILFNPAQQVYTPSPEETTKKSYSNDKGIIPISKNFMSTVPKTLEVPEKTDKISNENQAPEKNKLDKDPTSNPGVISIKGSSITLEEMKNKFASKHPNKIGFNLWQNKGKTKTKKSLASVRKAKHPYEKSPDMQWNNNVYGQQQPTVTMKCQMDENRVENLEVRSFSKKIKQMNDNLKILSGDKSISEPVQKFNNLMGVNLNPGGIKLRQVTAGLGDSTDSLFSARDSLLSFGSTISTGSYNSAGSIDNPLRSSLKKVKNKTTCESVLSTASGYSAASGRKSVRIAVGGEQTTV